MIRQTFTLVITLGSLLITIPASAAENLTLDINGLERRATVYAANTGAETPAPLVLMFHGRGDNVTNFAREVAFHRDWPEATVVYAAGLKRGDERGLNGWLGAPGREDSNHDMVFVDRLLEELPKRYPVDPRRVYAAGFSNGGRFSFILLAERSSNFAAFVMIGALSPRLDNVATPRPVMYLFGQDEPGQYQEAWQDTVMALIRANESLDQPQSWAEEFHEFPASANGAPTIINRYRAGHTWPYDGNKHIIRFFKAHTLP